MRRKDLAKENIRENKKNERERERVKMMRRKLR